MKKADAEELISFLELLSKFIYEFPQRVPKRARCSNGETLRCPALSDPGRSRYRALDITARRMLLMRVE